MTLPSSDGVISRRANKASSCLMLALVAALLFLPMLAAAASDQICADCHEEVVTGFEHSPHGIYFSGRESLSEKGCQACHGSGDQHVQDNEAASIINPARTDQFGGTELCLSCHQGSAFDDWTFSHHANANLSCASCHKVHAPVTEVKPTAPELCYDCHADVRASFSMPSHHPVAEGKMNCLDCHGVHGKDNRMALDDGNRELCFSCHAEKEGPFVYEHVPVNEDCGLCHSPHGTPTENLLTQSEPALCLNCHAMHFHATVEGYDTTFVAPLYPERSGEMTEDSWKSAFLTKCTQCHTAVHGTDLPSQATSTGGNALTR